MAQEETLEAFVDKLIEEKGITDLEADVMEQLKEDLMDRVEDRINVRIVQYMPDGKLEEFDNIIATGDMDKIQKFTHDNIDNLDQIIAKELLDFRKTYLGL
ncbi:MAG: DUF5663 domain-containing protein [Candidatus Spechtbacterales bacterium]|nr:DUF5663 domain-containing protein [Candidatus Spechtbacterales bacterium]